jgi:OOP family OmpA-OmpF porin
MKLNPILRLLALAGLGPLLAAPALAQQEGGYFYGGLSLGASRAEIDQQRIANSLLGAGLTLNGFNADERGKHYKLFGGYQMNRYLGVEAGFFDLGRFGFNASTTPPGTLDGSIRLRGFNLDLVATLPLTERLSALGRVGVTSVQARDNFSGSGAVTVLNPNPSQRSTQPKIGAGLQYEFSPSFLARLEAEHHRVNDAVGNRGSVNTLSVGLVFPFGRAAAPMPRMAAAPAYVPPPPPPPPPAPMPAPAPVIVAPPVPPPPVAVVVPERRRVSFSAESLFGFDQSTIQPAGRTALDGFASETRGTQFEVVTVEGHTDRLGSDDYNQKLSQRRADAVKAYLVSSGGFDAGKVNAVGKGETQPVTKDGECKGTKASTQLVICLQPDRRVEIEVSGTR